MYPKLDWPIMVEILWLLKDMHILLINEAILLAWSSGELACKIKIFDGDILLEGSDSVAASN